MIHYHGTPLRPIAWLAELMGGRHLAVSFAWPEQVRVAHKIAQSVMLDNGAYSFWTRGTIMNWKKYYKWCNKWLIYPTTWAVIPDVIDGGEEVNDKLIKEWPFGHRGAPVWHLHESFERLECLCQEWPRVCFGSSGIYREVGSVAWHHRMTEAFSRIVDERGAPTVWVHMLRGLKLATNRYPIASADSAVWARQMYYRKKKMTKEEMLKRVAAQDATQLPPLFKTASLKRFEL